MKKILFLLPYPLHQAPSQRFRVEAYFGLLRQQGIAFETSEFLDQRAWAILYKKGSLPQKAAAVLKGFLRRSWLVFFASGSFDYVFVHREAAPLGPPLFEWWLAKVRRKKLIYDFDDAIWIPAITGSNRLAASVKCFWKIRHICRWAYKVAAGNDYLASFARAVNPSVYLLPTCVDTETRYNRVKAAGGGRPVIGWTGSHSTLKYLDPLVPVLQALEQHFDFTFLVICNQPPAFTLRNFEFLPWTEASEISDLLKIDIGVMPLEQDPWSEGKCGFKIIQYLALGIPAVASPVGVNRTIIEEGRNGFLCGTPEQWEAALARLLQSPALRKELGAEGRRKMVAQYSVGANARNFLSLFS